MWQRQNWASQNQRVYEEIDFNEVAIDDVYQLNENNKIMNKIKQIFTSRTVWTLIVLFVVNGVSGIHDLIPVSLLPFVDGILGVLAVYFKVKPSQEYN